MFGRQYHEALADLVPGGQACLGGSSLPSFPEESGYEEDSPPTERRPRAGPNSGGAGAVSGYGVPGDTECTVVSEGSVVSEDEYRERIRSFCDNLRDFLLEKNESYGNSAFEPINIFSQLDARQGILVRIDDKIKRIRNGRGYVGDNDLKDLTGYLILLQVIDS